MIGAESGSIGTDKARARELGNRESSQRKRLLTWAFGNHLSSVPMKHTVCSGNEMKIYVKSMDEHITKS